MSLLPDRVVETIVIALTGSVAVYILLVYNPIRAAYAKRCVASTFLTDHCGIRCGPAPSIAVRSQRCCESTSTCSIRLSEDGELVGLDAARGAPRTRPRRRRRRRTVVGYGRRQRWIRRVEGERGSAGEGVADGLAADLLLVAGGAVAVEPLAAPRRCARGGGGECAIGESVEQDVNLLRQILGELVQDVLRYPVRVCRPALAHTRTLEHSPDSNAATRPTPGRPNCALGVRSVRVETWAAVGGRIVAVRRVTYSASAIRQDEGGRGVANDFVGQRRAEYGSYPHTCRVWVRPPTPLAVSPGNSDHSPVVIVGDY